jgi:hypothetical protein
MHSGDAMERAKSRNYRMLFRTMALAVVGAVCFATAAFAGNFEITNGTDKNVHHLYLSPASQDSWGPDQLGNGHDDVIDAGGKFTLTGVEDGTYDVKLTLEDGTACVAKGVAFEGDMEWKIDEEMVASC